MRADVRPAATRRPMFPLRWWTPFAVFLPAYVLRIFRLGEVVNFLDDRWMNVPAGFNYARFGFTGPDNWFTQPAKHFFMYWSSVLFGNDVVGWSMRQVLFGSAIVLLTFLLARRVFRVPFPAIAAAVLVGLDPLMISFSRAGSEDPLAVAFILAAMLFWMRGNEHGRNGDWLAAGLLIGTASALRWYALLVAALMLGLALWRARHDGGSALGRRTALLLVAPFGAYLAWYLPWLARGYSLAEWVGVQWDAFVLQGTGVFPSFDSALDPLTGAGQWFWRWMGVGTTSSVAEGESGVFTVIMNDPAVWFLMVPAIGYLLWWAYRNKRDEYLLIGGTFVVLYAFFTLVDRPIYLYSAIAVLPFGFMALGWAAGRLLQKRALVALGVAAAWGLYLYPLTSAVRVPLWAYGWLLQTLGVAGGGS